MNYRADLDGLRAIAVAAVILFHAGFKTFAGGFIGVDVFFVISGYLITSIILSDLELGRFTLKRFFESRLRRIVPALLLVSAVCIPFALLWLIPREMVYFGRSLIAANTFVSNILFWRESGYFSAAAELKPLLHTWSLSIEMQFYLLHPIVLLIICKYQRKFLGMWIMAFTAASFALAEWGASATPVANFYLLPGRAWELDVGACVALAMRGKKVETPRAATLFSGTGILLIVGSLFLLDDMTPYPGRWTLLPVLGTALIIRFAEGTVVARLLAHRALVGIGLISYSLYLWHQPLFAFARVRLVNVTPEVYGLLILAATALAFLTWKYVERPSRTRMQPINGLLRWTSMVAFLLITVGASMHFSRGFPVRNAAVAVLESDLRANTGLGPDPCLAQSTCLTAANPEVLLWGDSYAMHLADGIMAANPTLRLAQATMSVCGPFFDIAPVSWKYGADWAKSCISFNDRVKEFIKQTPSLRVAILSSPLSQYTRPDTLTLADGLVEVRGIEFVIAEFKRTLSWLSEHKITPIVVSPTPQDLLSKRDFGRCVMRRLWLELDASECDIVLAGGQAPYDPSVFEFLRTVEQDHEVVWLSDFLCADGRCSTSRDNLFIYRDEGHLSRTGSRWLALNTPFLDSLKQFSMRMVSESGNLNCERGAC